MFRHPKQPTRRVLPRRGLTLIELMISTAIVAMIAVALATLGTAVNESHEVANNVDSMTKHGQSTIRRIRRAIEDSYANTAFPGFSVFSRVVGSTSIPDALVVWTPLQGNPTNPLGLPVVGELTVFMIDENNPTDLLQVTEPGSVATVPALSNLSAWATLLGDMQTNGTVTRLTKYVRTVPITGGTVGQVRFHARLRPDQSQIDAYINGNADWDDIYWPQNLFTDRSGTRQHQCLVEIQLQEAAPAPEDVFTFHTAVPVYFLELKR